MTKPNRTNMKNLRSLVLWCARKQVIGVSLNIGDGENRNAALHVFSRTPTGVTTSSITGISHPSALRVLRMIRRNTDTATRRLIDRETAKPPNRITGADAMTTETLKAKLLRQVTASEVKPCPEGLAFLNSLPDQADLTLSGVVAIASLSDLIWWAQHIIKGRFIEAEPSLMAAAAAAADWTVPHAYRHTVHALAIQSNGGVFEFSMDGHDYRLTETDCCSTEWALSDVTGEELAVISYYDEEFYIQPLGDDGYSSSQHENDHITIEDSIVHLAQVFIVGLY